MRLMLEARCPRQLVDDIFYRDIRVRERENFQRSMKLRAGRYICVFDAGPVLAKLGASPTVHT